MAKYKHIVEAEQFVDGILLEGMTIRDGIPGMTWQYDHGNSSIHGIHGISTYHSPVEDGDWIVRHPDSNPPCPYRQIMKPDLFAATYEEVEE